jgi:uncharacterized membrane protein (UPF0127 family)
MSGIQSWPNIRIGKYTLYIASTPEHKKQGLQFVDRLPVNHLVFFKNIPAGNYFHTINCAFPMDIISLNSDNKVLNIWSARTNMKLIGPTPPQTTSVVEAPLGWAKQLGLQIGSNLMEALLA